MCVNGKVDYSVDLVLLQKLDHLFVTATVDSVTKDKSEHQQHVLTSVFNAVSIHTMF